MNFTKINFVLTYLSALHEYINAYENLSFFFFWLCKNGTISKISNIFVLVGKGKTLKCECGNLLHSLHTAKSRSEAKIASELN